ncbi:MAG: hypothetical protein E7586_01455 [Ruminococcaceae bacterium]|nr:hypothetical protein [Oscillospiraceae bacterium]
MKVNFTTQQINAIETKEKTLLVSAGAGSGKTTVLTKRLIDYVKNGGNITRFLVVTFMNAAAADVKAKLQDALLKELAADPENKHLYNQTQLISEANICTISSYCLGLVKENFALLGISPKVRVLDETESAVMLRRVTDGLIKKGYDEENPSFLLLADNFTGDKNDEKLADVMMNLFKTLQVVLDREELLKNCAEKLISDAEIIRNKGLFQSEFGKELKERMSFLYNELLASAEEIYNLGCTCGDDRYVANLDTLYNKCQNVCNAIDKDYVNYTSAAYDSCKLPTFYQYKCDKETHEYIKVVKSDIADALKKYCAAYCCGSETLIAESFEKTAEIIYSVNKFINEMEEEFKAAKFEINALDYADFELLALELLETTDEKGNKVPTELCLTKQKEFDEILIDEYQDVNPLQDKLFALLAGKSNRFMVGDVKQSIYRFRNAYPGIFLNYKKAFPEISKSEDSETACIFLRENFRCSKTVINYVNHVFQTVTENTPFRDEYEDEWLIYPEKGEEEAKKLREFPVILAIAEKEKDKAKEARRNEAEYIAREITRLVRTETSADGTPLKYSDFAVMMSAMKGYSYEYEKAFKKFGVPYKTAVSSSFLDNPIVSLAVSALKTIDDPTDDISLCALLRSPIGKFSSNDLYRIRNFLLNTEFYNALCSYSISKPKAKGKIKGKFTFKKRISPNHTLAVRCREFLKILALWREESVGVTCSEFIKNFLVSSGLLRIAADGGRSSLLLLYEYSTHYENSVNYGLSGFLDYLKELASSGKEIADVANVGEDDAISFITVHKSKGLEFKVCFLAGTDKKFRSNASNINFRRGEGLYFKLRDRARLTTYNPICNKLAVEKEAEQMRGEELRKLYVALTRAKERLYITGCVSPDKLESTYTPMNSNSWLEMLLYVDSKGECSFADRITITEAEGKQGYLLPELKKYITPTEEMKDIIKFRYPYETAIKTAAKVSVSELREGLLEDDEYNRTYLSVPTSRVSLKPSFAGEELVGATDIGTANHLFMQFCDFALAEKDINAEISRLVSVKMLSQKQAEMLDEKALSKFFASNLYMRIKESKKVYREKRFSVKDIFGDNQSILVQGVIDCFFQNPDGSYTVVDYKTDRVKSFDELAKRHGIQLDCYRRAVERMTGSVVKEVLLYSFALGGEVSV